MNTPLIDKLDLTGEPEPPLWGSADWLETASVEDKINILGVRTRLDGEQLQYACKRMKEWDNKTLFEKIFNF